MKIYKLNNVSHVNPKKVIFNVIGIPQKPIRTYIVDLGANIYFKSKIGEQNLKNNNSNRIIPPKRVRIKSAGKIIFNIPGISEKKTLHLHRTNLRSTCRTQKVVRRQMNSLTIKRKSDIIKIMKVVIRGHRNHRTVLWRIPLNSTTPQIIKRSENDKKTYTQ